LRTRGGPHPHCPPGSPKLFTENVVFASFISFKELRRGGIEPKNFCFNSATNPTPDNRNPWDRIVKITAFRWTDNDSRNYPGFIPVSRGPTSAVL
jgi:hypothetical protein